MDEPLLYFAAVLSGKPGAKIVYRAADLRGRYWDRTSDLFGVNPDWVRGLLVLTVLPLVRGGCGGVLSGCVVVVDVGFADFLLIPIMARCPLTRRHHPRA